MSAWTPVTVNGALADSLVADLTLTDAPFSGLPSDARLCLELHYSSDAATQVQIFLATAAVAAAQDIVMIYDSAFQVNPAADSTQYLTGLCVDVPIGINQQWMQLRITKAASNATIRYATTLKMGPGC